MPLVVRAFPLYQPVAALNTFAAALSDSRSKEADEFYRRYGVSHESWHVEETPSGPWVIAVTVLDNPQEAGPRYAGAMESFETWFRAQVFELTGVDPACEPLGPPTTQVFAWCDKSRPKNDLCT